MSQQHNGTSAVDEVLAFFSEWGPTLTDMRDSMERRFTPETVWENVGASKTVGREQEMAFTDAFNAQMSVASAEAIGRAHVCTPVHHAQLVCRLLLDKNKQQASPHMHIL